MNPPYAQPLITEFAKAVARKFSSREIEQACILVNNATETEWFRTMAVGAAAICFLEGRVKFLDETLAASGAPLQGQAVIYMGPNCVDFARCFSEVGIVVYLDAGRPLELRDGGAA